MLRWGISAITAALAFAGCGGGDAVGPTAAAPAQLDHVAALTLAQQSVNARVAVPHAVALAAVSPSSATATENFESGMADWSNWGNAQVVAGTGTSGSKAMQVGTGAGGAGLTVPGIAPGTAYRLTAQVKVSDPSETVYIGINMLSSSGAQVVGHSSPPVTGTGYTTVTVDLVAPADAATAVVWIWKNAGSGYAYLDDVAFEPAASAPPPPPPPPESNLVSNGGFESGMTAWANWGNASVVAGQANSGASALSVGTAAGGAGQDVGGIVPGTAYRLVARAKVSDPSETVFVGVNLLNQAGTAVAQMATPVSSTTYSTVTFDITAPADAVKAVVYVWKNGGSGFGYLDDVVFGVASGSAPPPAAAAGSYGNLVVNGGFENGLANWVDWGNTNVAWGAQAASGSYAAQVGTGDGGFGQTVSGIVAGTTYRLSAVVQVSSAGESAALGVRFTDDAGTKLLEQAVTFSSTGYSTVQLNLTAPQNATKALVSVWKNAGSGFAYVDQVELAQAVQIVPLTVTREQVNPVQSGRFYDSPAMDRLTAGGYVIAWRANYPYDGVSTSDICFHRYDANGASSAPAACVPGAHSAPPAVVARPDGGFTIMWNEGSSTADPRTHWQDYDASGSAQGAIQSGPVPIWLSARPLVGGGYVKLVFAGQSAAVSFQLYAPDGTPVGSPQPVFGADGFAGKVVGLAGGGFAVAWQQGRGFATPTVAMTRAFSADGSPLGEPAALAPNTLGPINCGKYGTTTMCQPWQAVNGITATADGGYMVAWMDGTGGATTGRSFARLFRADGSPASNVVGGLGNGLVGPIAAVGTDSFVMATIDTDNTGVSALHVLAAPLR